MHEHHKENRQNGPLLSQQRRKKKGEPEDPEGEGSELGTPSSPAGGKSPRSPKSPKVEEEADGEREEMDIEALQERFELVRKDAMMKQTAVSRIIFVLFLSFPNLTNKIFAFFMCYETGDKKYSFMFEDLGRTCTDDEYALHTWLCTLAMFMIPLGIPFSMAALLQKHNPAIMRHEGPHEYESMYIQYKPECLLWDTVPIRWGKK